MTNIPARPFLWDVNLPFYLYNDPETLHDPRLWPIKKSGAFVVKSGSIRLATAIVPDINGFTYIHSAYRSQAVDNIELWDEELNSLLAYKSFPTINLLSGDQISFTWDMKKNLGRWI